MSILNSVSPSKKYDDLGIYYRKNFLSQEEAEFIYNYCSSNKLEGGKYESGYVKSNFIKSREEGWDQFKSIISKITTDMKSVYSTESIYVNAVKTLDVSNLDPDSSPLNQAYSLKDTESDNGVIVKKFMLPTIDGWLATDSAEADPAWCVIVGLTTDNFEEGGEINVGSASEKINSGDVIWFKGDVAAEFSISSFNNSAATGLSEGEVNPKIVKSVLDLTLTNNVQGYWSA